MPTSIFSGHFFTALAVAVTLGACATKPQPAATSAAVKKSDTPLRPVHHVDLPRYMGDWRVIANIPYFAEKGCVDSIESYALRPDGVIENWFTYRKKTSTRRKRQSARARRSWTKSRTRSGR